MRFTITVTTQNITQWVRGCLLGMIATIIILVVSGPPARATFPGENGHVAYQMELDKGTLDVRTAIFLTDSGQLTFPPPGYSDFDPVWSPDGEEIAFTEYDKAADDYRIEIIGKDGTGRRQLISSDAIHENAWIHAPAWSNDGQRLAFSVRNLDSTPSLNGIWTVAADGSGLTQVVQEYHPLENKPADWPSWSPVRNEIAYVCWFRTWPDLTLRNDMCIVNVDTRARRTIPIDGPPGSTRGEMLFGGFTDGPKWSPDGEKLVFPVRYTDVQVGSNGQVVSAVVHIEVFTVKRDGTGLTQVTNSPVLCPSRPDSIPKGFFYSPTFSPDGAWIVSQAFRYSLLDEAKCLYVNDGGGIWMISSSGGAASLLVPQGGTPFPFTYAYAEEPDWQPILSNLTVDIKDGHGNPLKGLKVELRTPGGTSVDARPVNTVGGTYVFEEQIPPGDYVLKATLIDDTVPPGTPPAFEIRYSEKASEAAWVEKRFTQADSSLVLIQFDDSPDLVGSNVPVVSHLDDIANIYFRVRQFVDWVKTRLTADTGPTVEFYTFATADPQDGSIVGPKDAYQIEPTIVFGTTFSEYENRDGKLDQPKHDDDAPENGEWHEFTHHLYETFVNNKTSCDSNYTNHGGYNNPDTCDSMDEGFAAFLPTLAAQEIEGAKDADYDGLYNLEVNAKAWGFRTSSAGATKSAEDLAVAALMWDLVDGNADTEATQVIGANGLHRAVTYTDTTSMPIRQLWNQLTSSHPATVFDLRISFGSPALTIDLDGNGTKDVAPIDEVFLMHGFFPIDRDQTITDSHKTYHYNVAYAPGTPNNSVGESSHKVYDASGAVEQTFIPRFKTPLQPHANLEIRVVDPSGAPLSGAILDMHIEYPGGLEDTVSRRLEAGDGALVHLELPPYFDYLLPTGASLPDCDPVHDFHVQVTMSATVNGVVSSETPSFDNCTYQHAVASATGDAALSFTLTVPIQGGGTPEVCDGIDNDMDGQVDEDLGTLSCGVGACARIINACVNGVTQTCTPGTPAAEVCDGIDNNCDGQTDEGVQTTFYQDADSDTYGNASVTTLACVLPVGYANDSTDCNDGSASVHPGALEVCANSVDDDCDGQVDEGCSATYSFTGFFQPVDNPPTLNSVKAGSGIPVKFSLHGNQGLNIFEVGYPKSQAITCDLTSPQDGIEETVTAGSSSLSYDASTDQYTYVWKTDKAWANQCRQLNVTLKDGSSYMANFKFTK